MPDVRSEKRLLGPFKCRGFQRGKMQRQREKGAGYCRCNG